MFSMLKRFHFLSVRGHHLGVPYSQTDHCTQHELFQYHHHRCHDSLWNLVHPRCPQALRRTSTQCRARVSFGGVIGGHDASGIRRSEDQRYQGVPYRDSIDLFHKGFQHQAGFKFRYTKAQQIGFLPRIPCKQGQFLYSIYLPKYPLITCSTYHA
jgi:hypothetical protein